MCIMLKIYSNLFKIFLGVNYKTICQKIYKKTRNLFLYLYIYKIKMFLYTNDFDIQLFI